MTACSGTMFEARVGRESILGVLMDEEVERWSDKHNGPLALETHRGKAAVAKASRAYDLPSSGIESWLVDGRNGTEYAHSPTPQDHKEQHEPQPEKLQQANGEAMLNLIGEDEVVVPARRGRAVSKTVRQGLKVDGPKISSSDLCRYLGVLWRAPTKAYPEGQKRFAKPIGALIERHPWCDFRTMLYQLHKIETTGQRVFGLMARKAKSRTIGFRSNVQEAPFGGMPLLRASDDSLSRPLASTGLVSPLAAGARLRQPRVGGLTPVTRRLIKNSRIRA